MQKFIYLFIPFLLISISSCDQIRGPHESGEEEGPYSKQQRIDGAIEYTRMTSSDVETGEIPFDKYLKAIEEGERRVQAQINQRSGPGSIADPVWRERGPNNRGGRTRAIMIDKANPNRIWVGGVSGGLWRSEDITQDDPQWQKLGIYFASLAISDIKQDPNDLNTIYVSTGESYTGDVPGAGIFKSTDDGATWALLPSTQNSVMQTINEIHVHTNGDIYAATSNGGILRSQNGGTSWIKVLGSGMNGALSNNFHDFIFNATNQQFYTCNDNSIFRSATGNANDWVNIGSGKPGFPSNVNRIEMTICPNDPDIIYMIGAIGSFSSNTFFTNDGGENWTSRVIPAIFGDYGQAWYDLELTVDPTNCFRLLSGGVVLSESTFQALSWRDIAQNVHVDHHNITFDPNTIGRVYYGNDGGIWFSQNGGSGAVDKSGGYVTTQFYACAIHPAAGSPYCMGGTQDNNSLILEEPGLSSSRIARGGDGIFCFIDQNEPNIQIVSSQGGNYSLSTNGGQSFGVGATIDGAFINRSGYDNNANILYGQVNNQGGGNDVDFFRWSINSGLVDYVDITTNNISLDVSAVMADPRVPNRIFFGGQGGQVWRIDNAHVPGQLQVSGVRVADFPGSASVSSIYMDSLTSDHILVSMFNYGSGLENLYVTYNAGADWVAIEGDLPDLPIRWAIFDPADHDKAMIATDAGVWTTDDINGASTHWVPSNPDNGMPFVRVDMLVMRNSDKVVLAGTYGRGLMTTDIFAAPAAVIVTQAIGYEGQSIKIDGSQSVNAENYQWNLGDNTTSTEPILNHTYSSPGVYTLTLTINGNVSKTKTIFILPYLPAPYQAGDANYAGDFDTQPEHFAAYNAQGTGFQRGSSSKAGKDGTHSGNAAWVLGINDNLYANNTRAELYTPMYDMTDPGLYELKFWTKYAVHYPEDGFQVEYSLDAGATWQQLGSKDDLNWYNYRNLTIADGAFPEGKSYFTNAQLNWTQYIKDVSDFSGQSKVSFRFVFRSDEDEPAQGLAIDDFEVTKYAGELKTTVTEFNGAYTSGQEITINWTTGLEYQCRQFLLERSYNGFEFEQIADIPAKGIVSSFPRQYETTDQNLRKVVYYRMHVINENEQFNYYYDFYTDTIVLRRDIDANLVYFVRTNPFTDKIYVGFSSLMNQEITARLFDVSGKLVAEEVVNPHSIAYVMDNLDLIPGVYVFSIQIGDEEPKAYKLLTLGN